MEMEFEEAPNEYARTVQYQNEGMNPENLQDSSIENDESGDQRHIGNFMHDHEDENPEDDIHSYIPSVRNTP